LPAFTHGFFSFFKYQAGSKLHASPSMSASEVKSALQDVLKYVKQALSELPEQDVRWEPILRKIAGAQSLATAHRFLRSLVFGAIRTGGAPPVSQVDHVIPVKVVQSKVVPENEKAAEKESKAVDLLESQLVPSSDKAAEATEAAAAKGGPSMPTVPPVSAEPGRSPGPAHLMPNGLNAATFNSLARQGDVKGNAIAGHAAQKVLPDTLFEKLVGNHNSQVKDHQSERGMIPSSEMAPLQSMEPGPARSETSNTPSSLVSPVVGVSNVESTTSAHRSNASWDTDSITKKRVQLFKFLHLQNWPRADADEEVSRWQIIPHGNNGESLTYSYRHKVRRSSCFQYRDTSMQ